MTHLKQDSPHFNHDLHVHLYGCLSAEMLWELARSKPVIDWKEFEEGYEAQFGSRPNMEALFQDPSETGLSQFRELYWVDRPGPFGKFQAKFNLIKAVANLKDVSEAAHLTREICQLHMQEGLRHVEYRMLFPPWVEISGFRQLVDCMCQELKRFEEETEGQFQGRFSLSLPRTEQGPVQYQWLHELMKEVPHVGAMTTSVDFCFIEEGYPPKHKRDLFHEILKDNQRNPKHALAILYHVGESFADKSLESAVRWIHESAEIGAHRLGHAIALGLPPELYLDHTSSETVEERLDQIEYDLEHQIGLEAFGVPIDREVLQAERDRLVLQDRTDRVQLKYDATRVLTIRRRQDYVMECFRTKSVCVESCPTSNLNIGMIADPAHHPLHRFLKAGFPVVIASDDPGIFHTTLADEIAWVRQHITNDETLLTQLANNSRQFRSEVLSKRTPH